MQFLAHGRMPALTLAPFVRPARRLLPPLSLYHSALPQAPGPSTPRHSSLFRAAAMAVTPETPVEHIPTPEDLKPIFKGMKLGPYDLTTRIVYGPLTRCRAINTIPADFSAKYYSGVPLGLLLTTIERDGHDSWTLQQFCASKQVCKRKRRSISVGTAKSSRIVNVCGSRAASLSTCLLAAGAQQLPHSEHSSEPCRLHPTLGCTPLGFDSANS